jgi:hypothetical protein
MLAPTVLDHHHKIIFTLFPLFSNHQWKHLNQFSMTKFNLPTTLAIHYLIQEMVLLQHRNKDQEFVITCFSSIIEQW